MILGKIYKSFRINNISKKKNNRVILRDLLFNCYQFLTINEIPQVSLDYFIIKNSYVTLFKLEHYSLELPFLHLHFTYSG